jgi:N-methylhydantoinase A
VDEGGALLVGPQSAGAEPGPAGYGRGGPATTTDAHLVLGRLGSGSLLGGRFAVDRYAAERALESLGFPTVEEAAKGVIAVANVVMARTMRVVSVERGHHPSGFTLVAFGGAGPLHACELADELEIPRVLVPTYPGLMSAIGMTRADTTRDHALALLETHRPGMPADGLMPLLVERMATLSALANEELPQASALEWSLDVRYEGQGHELNVPWDGKDAAGLLEGFHALHERRYGHAGRGRAVELITLRLRARIPREPISAVELEPGGSQAGAAKTGERIVMLERPEVVPVFGRDRLRAGNLVEGPAIVEQVDSTTLIPRGWVASVHPSGTLILTRDSHGH